MTASDTFTVTQFDLLRHGECEGGNIFRGSTDVQLTPAGFASMRASCDKANTAWQAIISSPLQRCVQFAKALSSARSLPMNVDRRLKEIGYGDWEGIAREKIRKTRHEEYKAWIGNPELNPPPGGESLQSVSQRLNALLEDTLSNHNNKSVLLVAHSGVIRILLSQLLKMPLQHAQQIEVPFASLTRIKIYEKQGSRQVKLVAHNFIGQPS